MRNLKYLSHKKVYCIHPYNYYYAALIILFIENQGLTSEISKISDLENWLEEKIGWEIHTGCYRKAWEMLGMWQKYRLPRHISEADAEFLKNSNTFFKTNIFDYRIDTKLFYYMQQFARYINLYISTSENENIIVDVAKKLNIPCYEFGYILEVTQQNNVFDYEQIKEELRLIMDEISPNPHYFEWYDYRVYLDRITSNPYKNKVMNPLLTDLTMIRPDSKQINISICPKNPRWSFTSPNTFKDTYIFDDNLKQIRKRNGQHNSIKQLQIGITSYDHLYDSDKRISNLDIATQTLINNLQ